MKWYFMLYRRLGSRSTVEVYRIGLRSAAERMLGLHLEI